MATGDQSDILARLQSAIPRGWFGDSPSVLTALLSGIAAIFANVYSVFAYAKLQMRIATATDGWLDLIANDFFGTSLTRKQNESDAQFRARIVVNLFRERATRHAVRKVLLDLTGREPIIFQPRRPKDTGGYSVGGVGYGVAGGYGSLLLPYQMFVTAYRPSGSGIPNIAGYGVSTGGYRQPSQAEYATYSSMQIAVSDSDIYAAIESVKPAGTIIWTRISN
jgi:hypothetical protein